MSTVPHQSIAATAHFVEAERILAALPLATKRANGTIRCGSRS
jgi:hypothetical protein